MRALTTRADGTRVPKQYCSLTGDRSLLRDALSRASRIVDEERILVVVAAEHVAWWSAEPGIPPCRRVVQPRNRGTVAGILLPLFTLLERDPGAQVVLLPSDHCVEREDLLEGSLRGALATVEDGAASVVLLGITPDGPESDYGWIVPERAGRTLSAVRSFVEKPGRERARELWARSGVWNSFLLAARGSAILALVRRRMPALVESFERVFAEEPHRRPAALRSLYEGLGEADFSREVLQGCEDELRLHVVPECGWTDLGTPARVVACLARLAAREASGARRGPLPSGEPPCVLERMADAHGLA